MRKQIFIFIFCALFTMTIVPIINLYLEYSRSKRIPNPIPNIFRLYNFDFALPFLNSAVHSIGISTRPEQVIVGRDGWLYLGDRYDKTISVGRAGTTIADEEAAKKIEIAAKTWEQWLKLEGVSAYRIMLGPNKDTIYPEYLPEWARQTHKSATDTLMANVSKNIYVDTRTALKAAKSQRSELLYYKNDTHWNSLGAWVAFRAFAMEFDRTDGGVRWPSEQQIHISRTENHPGGDLANFLGMTKLLRESEMHIEILTEKPIETMQYDFETGRLVASGGNPRIGSSHRALIVKSKNALNQKRVLWLRDSFGSAIAPFMAATFTETLQMHYNALDSGRLAQLVNTYNPDYVFVTVVERGALGRWFQTLPPPLQASDQNLSHLDMGPIGHRLKPLQ